MKLNGFATTNANTDLSVTSSTHVNCGVRAHNILTHRHSILKVTRASKCVLPRYLRIERRKSKLTELLRKSDRLLGRVGSNTTMRRPVSEQRNKRRQFGIYLPEYTGQTAYSTYTSCALKHGGQQLHQSHTNLKLNTSEAVTQPLGLHGYRASVKIWVGCQRRVAPENPRMWKCVQFRGGEGYR